MWNTCPIRNEHSTVVYFLHLGWLWVSVFTTAGYCKWKFLWWGLKDALIDECNTKPLGVGIILYPFSRIMIAGSSLGPKACLATGSWPDSVARWVYHVPYDLNPIRKLQVTPIMFMPLLYLWAYLQQFFIFFLTFCLLAIFLTFLLSFKKYFMFLSSLSRFTYALFIL